MSRRPLPLFLYDAAPNKRSQRTQLKRYLVVFESMVEADHSPLKRIDASQSTRFQAGV